MIKKNEDKIHLAKESRDEKGNLVMWCGKVFSSGDRKRLKSHVTSLVERLTCLGCATAAIHFWMVEQPDDHWFSKEKKTG